MAATRAAVVVYIPGYPAPSMLMSYLDVADSLVWGLQQLGYEARRCINEIDQDALNIVVGFQIPSKLGASDGIGLLASWPRNTIVYNLEQYADHPGFAGTTAEYVARRFQVWDYSARNLLKWREVNCLHTPRLVPIGYAPILKRIEAGNEDIDLLFYGKLSAQRLDFVNRLTDQQHLQRSFLWLKNIWGPSRDELIRRSKVVLNLTGYQPSNTIFEIVRVSYLLANERAVVCQRRKNIEIEPDVLDSGLLFVDESGFESEVTKLLENAQHRREYALACAAAFSRRDISKILEQALLS